MSSSNSLSLSKHQSFSGRSGPVVILVADGVGVAPPGPSNAVSEANTPTLDALAEQTLYTELAAHGTAVGLPSDGDMGNSEVGHNALGAGRIFAQGAKLVNEALNSGSIYQTSVWQNAIENGKKNTLHLLGLHSDGNVHAHTQHLYALMQKAAEQGVRECCIHILLDGRDVAARSALTYVEQTEQLITQINDEHQANFRIASGGGRMQITMDRYEADWPMVQRGYNCHTHGIGSQFSTASEAVQSMYDSTGKDDQYLPAFVIAEDGKPVGKAMEISLAYERDAFDKFDRNEHRPHPDVFYAGMLQYDGDELIPNQYLVNPPDIDRTMVEFMCQENLKSFAVSENIFLEWQSFWLFGRVFGNLY